MALSTPANLARVRLHLLSDLHLEFAPFDAPAVDADVVVLAGDVHPGLRGAEWAAARWPRTPVVYVPGNHEFYGHACPRLVRKLEARAAALGAPLHVLSDRAVVLGGVRFAGATLWTDFGLFGTAVASRAAAQAGMSDYRRIRMEPDYRRCRATDTLLWHQHSVRWLTEVLAEPFDGPTVVVTHHAPSRRSLAPDDADPLAAAYASDLDALVAGSGAALWVHGHTHRRADYVLGTTRVVSNQRGYPDQRPPGFDPQFVVAV